MNENGAIARNDSRKAYSAMIEYLETSEVGSELVSRYFFQQKSSEGRRTTYHRLLLLGANPMGLLSRENWNERPLGACKGEPGNWKRDNNRVWRSDRRRSA